jgi:hypothetical protein
MATRPKKRTKKPAKVSHYLSGWAEDVEQTQRHLAQVIVDALCALKRLQVQGALDAYPEWKGEGSAMVQLGIPEGPDALYLKLHPFLPEGTPLVLITGSKELTSLMVGFSRGVSTRWRKRIVTGPASGPGQLPPVMMVDGASVVIAEGSLFAEHRAAFEEAGWKVRELGPRTTTTQED